MNLSTEDVMTITKRVHTKFAEQLADAYEEVTGEGLTEGQYDELSNVLEDGIGNAVLAAAKVR